MDPAVSEDINEVRGWRRLALWFLAMLLRGWNLTLRMEADQETRNRLGKSDESVAIVLWHNRLFISAEYCRRFRSGRSICALVSASKDGAYLAAFYRMVGIEPVRGSSSQFGREAARILIERLRDGNDIGITPDGPRGPLYQVEPGVLVVTRRTNTPMVLLGAEYARAWRLRSWDRFYIPWPFSRVKMRSTVLPPVDAEGNKLSVDELRTALLEINPDGADS